MYELHENEQYFFSEATIKVRSEFVSLYDKPCVLCAPLLGSCLAKAGVAVTVLDIDRRFESLPGFVYYDLQRPEWIAETFDLIVCDPPFFNVSLSRLFSAIRQLSHNDFTQKLLVSYLERRSDAITGTFAPFDLGPTGFRAEYETVQRVERNDIQFFSNLDADRLDQLHSLAEANATGDSHAN